MFGMGVSLQSSGDYTRGVRMLRDLVVHGRERDDWVRSRNVVIVHPEEIRVQITAPYTPDATIFVTLRSTDLYVSSVQNDHAAFYFSDCPPGRLVTNQVLLGFSSHYSDLGSFESIGRLSSSRVDGAVAAIAHWTASTPISSREKTVRQQVQSEDVRHLLTLILILSESARFYPIERTVENALAGRFDDPLTLRDIDLLVHEWGARSARNDTASVAVPTITRPA